MADRAYTLSDAQYAKGKKVIQVHDSRNGMKGRCSYLAEALGGKYTHRSHGYVMTPKAAERFELLFNAGFQAEARIFAGTKSAFFHTKRGLEDLSITEVLKRL